MFLAFVSVIFISCLLIALGVTEKIYPISYRDLNGNLFPEYINSKILKRKFINIWSTFFIISGAVSFIVSVAALFVESSLWIWIAVFAFIVSSFLIMWEYTVRTLREKMKIKA